MRMLADERMHGAMGGDKVRAGKVWALNFLAHIDDQAPRIGIPHDLIDPDAHSDVRLPLAFNPRRNGPFETA